jgi:hypothetical protein
MKSGAASAPFDEFSCAVCGARLDSAHLDATHEGPLCVFCGAPQGRNRADLQLVATSSSQDVGDTLRRVRHSHGETLEQAATFTRVRASYLRALEQDDYSTFEPYPGRVYARFFLRDYAQHLGLDPDPLLEHFDRDAAPAVELAPPIRGGWRPTRGWVLAAAAVLVLTLLGAFLLSRPTPAPDRMIARSNAIEHPQGLGPRRAAPPPPVKAIHARVQITDAPSWVLALVDGDTVMNETLPAGATRSFLADGTLQLSLGHATTVRLFVDGERVHTEGSVVDLSFALRDGRVVQT